MRNPTNLSGGASVTLYAMHAHPSRPLVGLASGLQCQTNDGAVVDLVVAAWLKAGYVVTYDVNDLGNIRQGDRTRHEALPIAGAYASFSYALAARLEAEQEAALSAFNAKGRRVRVSIPREER